MNTHTHTQTLSQREKLSIYYYTKHVLHVIFLSRILKVFPHTLLYQKTIPRCICGHRLNLLGINCEPQSGRLTTDYCDICTNDSCIHVRYILTTFLREEKPFIFCQINIKIYTHQHVCQSWKGKSHPGVARVFFQLLEIWYFPLFLLGSFELSCN